MAEYIDKAKTLHRMKVDIKPPFYVVQNMPAEDVAPVRHGRWVKIYENGEPAITQHQVGVSCIKCMKMPKDKFTESDFCPNCGAKMDLEDTECKES